MDPNTSAAIYGAIAGGVIAFAMGAYFRIIDEKRKRQLLAKSIKAELINYRVDLETGKEQEELILAKFNLDPSVMNATIIRSRGADLVIISNSIERIGHLNSSISLKIISFYAKHQTLTEMISWLNDNTPENLFRIGQNPKEMSQGLSNTYSARISECDDIISDLDRIIHN